MLLFSGKCLQAQLTTVKGSLLDTTSQSPVYNAVVSVLSAKDSVLIKFVRSRKDGTFEKFAESQSKNDLDSLDLQAFEF